MISKLIFKYLLRGPQRKRAVLRLMMLRLNAVGQLAQAKGRVEAFKRLLNTSTLRAKKNARFVYSRPLSLRSETGLTLLRCCPNSRTLVWTAVSSCVHVGRSYSPEFARRMRGSRADIYSHAGVRNRSICQGMGTRNDGSPPCIAQWHVRDMYLARYARKNSRRKYKD